MLIGELKQLLSSYNDEQYIQVLMEKDDGIRYQMIIQDVFASAGWHTDPCNPNKHIIRILIHENNKILPTKLMTEDDLNNEKLIAQNLSQVRKKMSYYDYYLKYGVYPDE